MSDGDFSFDMSDDDFGANGPKSIDFDEPVAGDSPSDDTGSGDQRTDAQKASDKAVAEAAAQKEANAVLLSRLDKVAADNEALRARFDTTIRDDAPKSPPGPVFDMDKFAQELSDLQVANPREYQKQLLIAQAQFIEQSVQKFVAPAMGSTTTLEIQNYRAANFKDDDAVREEFDAIISSPNYVKQLASISPEQRAEALAMVADMAYGRASRKGKTAGARDNIPPDLRGGNGAGNRPAFSFKGQQLTAAQRLIVQMAHESGITDRKRIAAMLGDDE